MITFLASFTVHPDHRDDYITQSLKTGQSSLASEPGTLAFELIADESNPETFYMRETYQDEDALNAHMQGPHFAEWYAAISTYAEGPTWLLKGSPVTADAVA